MRRYIEFDAYAIHIKGRTIRKVMWGAGGGKGNFRAAGIFFRYQIPCMDFFRP